MKCIACGTDNKLKERSVTKRCKECKTPFAFEPTTDALKITDGFFQATIAQVSGKGALFFTKRQLWWEFNRRLLKRPTVSPAVGLAAFCGIASIALSIATVSPIPVIIGVCGISVGAIINRKQKSQPKPPGEPKISFDNFVNWYVIPWVKAHGSIVKMMPDTPVTPKAPDNAPPDLAAYSFDRALVTYQAEIAAMLVANRFHFENNCAILSMDGYPGPIRDTVMDMLRRNPNLTVFAVHDATIAGCMMPMKLRDEGWFPDHAIRVVDLGLVPKHAITMRLMTPTIGPQVVPQELQGRLGPDEITWLAAGNVASLSSLRPAKLMRAIYQGFARAKADLASDGGYSDGGGVFIADGGSWGYDSSVDTMASDSFG